MKPIPLAGRIFTAVTSAAETGSPAATGRATTRTERRWSEPPAIVAKSSAPTSAASSPAPTSGYERRDTPVEMGAGGSAGAARRGEGVVRMVLSPYGRVGVLRAGTSATGIRAGCDRGGTIPRSPPPGAPSAVQVTCQNTVAVAW